jgi:1,4-alpha-glucan branching enzyme
MNRLTRVLNLSLFVILIVIAISCTPKSDTPGSDNVSGFNHPEWSKDMVVYELNVRQYTEEGTFSAIEPHILRLKSLGVDVIWFMPIHPIGEVNRKGELGSYYSVMDFKGVNPEFGTMEEFMSLVDAIHEAGMHVIIDWVPNHSSWDNQLAADHPEWYRTDSSGTFISPYDWTDVIQFDWSKDGLQEYMLEALLFWVEEAGIDGYRVDHPHVTPADFWARARVKMEEVKPVLMLAENEDRVEFFDNGFDMNYSWELHHVMNQVAQGEKSKDDLDEVLKRDFKTFPSYAYRMRFIDNHDENSWAGTINERMGDAQKAMAVYMYTIPGVPLLYNGQEAGLDKRLEFFERDPIEWRESDLAGFYTTLNTMKEENKALHNGQFGGEFSVVSTSGDSDVYAYRRVLGDNVVFTIINFSGEAAEFSINDQSMSGSYADLFGEESFTIDEAINIDLEGWGYMVLTR